MEFARPPLALSTDGSMNENWKDWKQQFIVFLKASGASDWSTERKASILLNLIGPVGQQVSQNFSPSDCENMETLMKKFDEQFVSKVTEARERYIFFSSARQSTETIDRYVDTLKIRARNCNFGELTESLIRDKIILDVKNKPLRKHFLNEPNLSLDDIIDLWKTLETSEKLTRLCLPKSLLDVVIKPEYRPSDDKLKSFSQLIVSEKSDCGRCGTRHEPKNCPAKGKKCENCGMMNHLAKSCTKPSKSDNKAQNESKVPKYFNPGPSTRIPILDKKNFND